MSSKSSNDSDDDSVLYSSKKTPDSGFNSALGFMLGETEEETLKPGMASNSSKSTVSNIDPYGSNDLFDPWKEVSREPTEEEKKYNRNEIMKREASKATEIAKKKRIVQKYNNWLYPLRPVLVEREAAAKIKEKQKNINKISDEIDNMPGGGSRKARRTRRSRRSRRTKRSRRSRKTKTGRKGRKTRCAKK